MRNFKIPYPQQKEVPEYYRNYVSYVQSDQLVELLEKEKSDTISLFESLNDDQLHFQYAEGKWTPKEILLHVIDAERVFAYRILRFGRNDSTPLPGFDQNIFLCPQAEPIIVRKNHLLRSMRPCGMRPLL